MWCGLVWCGVVLCGVVHCVVWCGVDKYVGLYFFVGSMHCVCVSECQVLTSNIYVC